MVFWQERTKMLTIKVQKKHKNITILKLRPTVTKKRKLREVVRKRGKIPCTHISTPKVQNCENVSWLSGFLLSSFSFVGKMWFNKSETSTHNHREVEIERGYKEEREGSPVPIFPPLNFKIMRLLTGWMWFCSKVSSLWVERGWSCFELKKEFYIKFGVLLMTGFWVVEESFIPYDTNLVFWLELLLFREEFATLLAWFWKCLTKLLLAPPF